MKKKTSPKPSKLLADALKLFGPKGERWAKGAEEIDINEHDDTGKVFPDGAYCAIGAVKHIDTLNEDKAIALLAVAIKLDTGNFDSDDEGAITDNNDRAITEFKDVKRWFTSAIKLAKSYGL